MKCDSYRTRPRTEYVYSPSTGQPLTSYDHYIGYCNGTREQDECDCGGDRAKCTFYPEVREKATKKSECKYCGKDADNSEIGYHFDIRKKPWGYDLYGYDHYGSEIGADISFCPMCGRNLDDDCKTDI